MANTELNINVFKRRLKVYRLSQLRMSAGRLFQIKTDECLKARDNMTVRVLLLLSNRLFDDRSVRTETFARRRAIQIHVYFTLSASASGCVSTLYISGALTVSFIRSASAAFAFIS